MMQCFVFSLQRCKPCQDKAVEQTFVVDSSRLLSFAVGYNAEKEYFVIMPLASERLRAETRNDGKECEHSLPSAGTPTLHRVGRAGHGRHGGGAVAKCGRPLMSALTFWSFLVKQKGQENAAIDATPPHKSSLA